MCNQPTATCLCMKDLDFYPLNRLLVHLLLVLGTDARAVAPTKPLNSQERLLAGGSARFGAQLIMCTKCSVESTHAFLASDVLYVCACLRQILPMP